MSRIHEFVIIPGAGHSGPGLFTRGHSIDAFAEVDLVDQYVKRMVDEFAEAGVRHSVVPTRRAPGVEFERRLDSCGEFSIPLICSVGWDKSVNNSSQSNVSIVRFGPEISPNLGAGLADVLAHWGGLYVFGHRRGTPVQEQKIRGVVLEPFRLNGPNAHQYARHLDALGRDIGRFLSDYCNERHPRSMTKAPSLLRRVQ